MPTSGGFPAARRVRTSGMKSRADVYWTLMPVFAVNAAVTFRNATFSLPPQSERTSMEFALRFAGFAPTLVAVRPATSRMSAKANATNDLRRFTRFLLPCGGTGGTARCALYDSDAIAWLADSVCQA